MKLPHKKLIWDRIQLGSDAVYEVAKAWKQIGKDIWNSNPVEDIRNALTIIGYFLLIPLFYPVGYFVEKIRNKRDGIVDTE